MIEIDTTNILFMIGEAFEGLEDKIKRRLNKKQMGFGLDDEDEQLDENTIFEHVLPEKILENLVLFGVNWTFTCNFSLSC